MSMRKALVRGAMTKAVRASRQEVVHQATAAAGEMLRVRREPAVVASRRVRSAQRRVRLWSAATTVPTAGVVVQLASHGVASFAGAEVLRTTIYLALLVVCVAALVRAVVELRERKAVQRTLPPPAPTRSVVAARIRPQLTRLGEFSDGLRTLAGLTGLDPSSSLARELRLDIVASADSAEVTLRRMATEFTDLEQAAATAPADARPGLRTVADQVAGQIEAGVTEYGNYVTAVSEIVIAGRSLRADSDELSFRTDQLRGLAMGLRELAG